MYIRIDGKIRHPGLFRDRPTFEVGTVGLQAHITFSFNIAAQVRRDEEKVIDALHVAIYFIEGCSCGEVKEDLIIRAFDLVNVVLECLQC